MCLDPLILIDLQSMILGSKVGFRERFLCGIYATRELDFVRESNRQCR